MKGQSLNEAYPCMVPVSLTQNLYARLQNQSYPCNRSWRPIGLWDVEAPIFSRQSAHRWLWGCQPYAPATLYAPGRFLVLISVRGWVDGRATVRLEGLGQLKKSNDLLMTYYIPLLWFLLPSANDKGDTIQIKISVKTEVKLMKCAVTTSYGRVGELWISWPIYWTAEKVKSPHADPFYDWKHIRNHKRIFLMKWLFEWFIN
jgi:hypothetical protein